MSAKNHLHEGLRSPIYTDTSGWEVPQANDLEGVWQWPLNPSLLNESDSGWITSDFWQAFGTDPQTMQPDPTIMPHRVFTEDLALAIDSLKQHCADPSHPYDEVVRFRHANGATLWIRCRGHAVRDAAGNPTHIMGAHTDVSMVNISKQSAQAGWRAAEVSNAELRSFAYSISHDMKVPANTMHLLLSEFQHHMAGQIDAEGQDIMDMCMTTIDRMQGLIEYLLDYSRLIDLDLALEDLDLNSVVKKVRNDLRDDIVYHEATVTIRDLPRIKAAGQHMEMFFLHLISNALKFCPSDRVPNILISQTGSEDPDSIAITVSDNGIGIPAHSQDRIFRLFQRLHSHNEIEGTGIGLPMCKHIALKHQGTLTVASEPGVGSHFTLHFPKSMLV